MAKRLNMVFTFLNGWNKNQRKNHMKFTSQRLKLSSLESRDIPVFISELSMAELSSC